MEERNLFLIQCLAFDLAGLKNVFGQGLKKGLRLKREAKRFHSPNQSSLPMPNSRKRGAEHLIAPT